MVMNGHIGLLSDLWRRLICQSFLLELRQMPQLLDISPTPCPIPLIFARLEVFMVAGGFATNYRLLWSALFFGGAAALVEWVIFLHL